MLADCRFVIHLCRYSPYHEELYCPSFLVSVNTSVSSFITFSLGDLTKTLLKVIASCFATYILIM